MSEQPPEGYRYKWTEEDNHKWRLLYVKEQCRMIYGRPQRRCPNTAVAELHRANGWWGYCDEHLYGRRIRDGRIEFRRTIPGERDV